MCAEHRGQSADGVGATGDAGAQNGPQIGAREALREDAAEQRQRHEHDCDGVEELQHRHRKRDDGAQADVGDGQADQREHEAPYAVADTVAGHTGERGVEVRAAGGDEAGAHVEACDDEDDTDEGETDRAECVRREVRQHGGARISRGVDGVEGLGHGAHESQHAVHDDEHGAGP